MLGKHLELYILCFSAEVQKCLFNDSDSYWLFLVLLEKYQIINGWVFCF